MVQGSTAKHTWLQKQIYERPHYAGIEEKGHLIARHMEYELMLHESPFVVPDLCFLTDSLETYLVEVKSGNNPSAFSKGMNQLERILYWYGLQGLPEPDVRLVMPAHEGQYWHDILGDLEIYKPGDRYDKYTKIR